MKRATKILKSAQKFLLIDGFLFATMEMMMTIK